LRGPLRHDAEAYLNDSVLKRDWYDSSIIQKAWRDHLQGVRDMSGMLYRLITAEQWYQQFGKAKS
jgi:hypothetical protein